MSEQTRTLLESVLALPEAEREELAVQLLDSLEEVEPRDEVDAAWGTEIERRMSDGDEGVEWEEARRLMFSDRSE